MKYLILSSALAGILWGTAGFFIRNLSGLNSIEIGWFRFFTGFIFLSLIVLILNPLTLFQSFAEVLALVSGIIFGFNLIVTRKTQQYHDSMTTIFYLFLIPSIVLFLPTIYSFDTPSLNQVFYIIFLGVLSGA